MKFCLFSLVAALLMGCERPSAVLPSPTPPSSPIPESAAVADFYRKGMLVQELVGQGTTVDVYGQRLAELKVAFREASPELNKSRARFEMAITAWDVALKLWQSKRDGYLLPSERREVLDIYQSIGQSPTGLPEQGAVETKDLVKLAMQRGAEEFTVGQSRR